MTTPFPNDSGSGRLAARWEIEGLPIQIVTDPAMEQTIVGGEWNGVERLCCTSLEDCGFAIDETVNLPEAKLEALSTGLMLWETVDEDLSQVFHNRPDVERFGAVTFSDSATVISLLSTTGFTAGDVIHIGTEALLINSITAPQMNVTRGYRGTVARKHWASDTEGVPDLLVTNRPLRFRGRRIKLYLYGDGDDLTGDGTLYWIGVVNAEPRLIDSGTRYHLSIGPLIDLLDAKLGGDLDEPTQPRGIYYSWAAPIYLEIAEGGSGFRLPAAWAGGFFETQRDFCDAFNTWLASTFSSADSTYRAEVTADGRWSLKVIVGSSTTSVSVDLHSPVDGATNTNLAAMRRESPDGRAVGTGGISSTETLWVNWLDGAEVPGGRTVPRGFFDTDPRFRARTMDPASAGTYPANRIYVDRPVASDWTAVSMDWGGGDSNVGTVTGASTSDNYIEVEISTPREDPWAPAREYIYSATQGIEIRPQRKLVDGAGTLADFRDALVAESINYADLGTAPFITSEDLADWTTIVDEAAVTPAQKRRHYYLSTPTDLLEMLSHECRLLGVFPMTESDGTIGLRKLGIPNVTQADLTDLTEEIATVDGEPVDLSVLSRGNQTVNRVVLKTGYDPIEEKWRSQRTANDKTSQALDHTDRPLTIEPRSNSLNTVTTEDFATMVVPVLSLFGYPHDFWSVKLPWTHFDLRCGDGVTFDAAHLPSYLTGTRPITDVVGMVVGRKWRFDQAYGEITILVSWQNIAGYSPTGRITGTSDQGGDYWYLTIHGTKYAPVDSAGAIVATPVSYFEVDDRIRVINIDSESATVHLGTVGEVDTALSRLGVQFDSTFTASGTQEVIFAPLTDSAVTDSQKRFCFHAGSDLLLGPDDEAPRTLGA